MENPNPNPNDAGKGVGRNYILQAYDDQRLQNVSRPQQEEEGSDNWHLGLSQSVKLGQLQPVDLLRRDEPFYSNPFPNTTLASSNRIVVKLSGEIYSFDITVGFLDTVGHIKDEIVQYILKTYGQKISTDRIILRNYREVELLDHEKLAAYDLENFSILQLKLRDEEEHFTVGVRYISPSGDIIFIDRGVDITVGGSTTVYMLKQQLEEIHLARPDLIEEFKQYSKYNIQYDTQDLKNDHKLLVKDYRVEKNPSRPKSIWVFFE